MNTVERSTVTRLRWRTCRERDQPPHGARERERQQREKPQRHEPARRAARRQPRIARIDDSGGQEHEHLKKERQQIQPRHPREEDRPRWDGQREEKFVVPRGIERRIRHQRAPDEPEQQCKRPHQRKIQPRKPRWLQCRAQRVRQQPEHRAESGRRVQKQRRVPDDGRAGAAASPRGAEIQEGRPLLRLFFQKQFKHTRPPAPERPTRATGRRAPAPSSRRGRAAPAG